MLKNAKGSLRLLAVVSYAFLIVGTLLFPGGLVAFYYGADKTRLLEPIIYLVLSFVLLICRAVFSPAPGTRKQVLLGVLLAFTILVLPVFAVKLGLRRIHQKTEHGLWVYIPNIDLRAFGQRSGKAIQINEYGFRGPGAPGVVIDSTVVSLVGGSYIFGWGVPDESTLAVVLEQNLNLKFQQSVMVRNFGHPRASLATAPLLTSYAMDKVAPELVVLLIQHRDLDWYDYNNRLGFADGNFLYTLLKRGNWEYVVDFVMAQTPKMGFSALSPEKVISLLNDTLNACEDSRLLVVTNLSEESSSVVNTWADTHSQVISLDVSDDPTWTSVDRNPRDGHWSAEGTRKLASSKLLEKVASILKDSPNN
jgi:hypothetical protein